LTLRIALGWIAAPVGLALALGALPSAAQEDGGWPMPGKNFAGFRYSDLDQINTETVAQLRVAWTFSLGVLRGQEAAPIVAGNTLFVVTPYPNIVYALDLTKPGAPVKWRHEPKPVAAAQGIACCDTVNRGAAYAGGSLFYNTLDGQTIALDADTGEELWRAPLGNINVGETITMAPLVVRDKVLVGNSGGKYGVRGWIAALDADDGSLAWRACSTGPDSEVLIGERFKPFYPQDGGKDLGVASWPPDAWRIGGGTIWGWLTYDPEADLLYHGTGNPGPWNPAQRPGDNKWTAGIFARDPDAGEAARFYQWTPHDQSGRAGGGRAGGALAWREWRRAGRHASDERAPPEGRQRFLGLLGLMLCTPVRPRDRRPDARRLLLRSMPAMRALRSRRLCCWPFHIPEVVDVRRIRAGDDRSSRSDTPGPLRGIRASGPAPSRPSANSHHLVQGGAASRCLTHCCLPGSAGVRSVVQSR
jgi:PQQ-like domain